MNLYRRPNPRPLTPRLLLALFTTLLMNLTVLAQNDNSIRTLQQTGRTFASIVAKASPAVVGIKAEKSVTLSRQGVMPEWPFENYFEEDFFRHFFRQHTPPDNSPQREYQQEAQGSGFLISSDGYILTNNHLVGNADKVMVKLSDQRQMEGKIVGTDPESDVAVIKIDASDLTYLKMADSTNLHVGEWVLAVGNPFGLTHSVTAGIISATGRSGVGIATYEDFIQTDAAINPGNSGGPLLNLNGDVVGINTAIISRTGGNLGIGLAIPSNMAEHIYNELREEGQVVRGYLGVSTQNITPSLAESFDLDDTRGVLIPHVIDGSAADKAGIQKGDIITALNGKTVPGAEELRNRVAMLEPGTRIKLDLLRDGRQKTIQVRLGKRPSPEEMQQDIDKQQEQPGKQLGIQVQTFTSDLAQQLGYEELQGVVITYVKAGSVAAQAGLRRGMVITEVNRKEITDAREFIDQINQAKQKDKVLLLVYNGRFNRYVSVRFEEQ